MAVDITLLAMTAGFIGLVHTIIGPDHYVPFIMMSRFGKWSFPKTLTITVLSGFGHVLSSVLLGALGIALGIAVSRLEGIESTRAQIATWGIIAFGLIYFIWGMKRALKKSRRKGHRHKGSGEHHHHHLFSWHTHSPKPKKNMTPWVLFTIFVFGPCEPLIPIIMYPAATSNMMGVVLVTAIFGICTVGTMTTIVMVSCLGLAKLEMKKTERYGHAIAGASILVCGLGMQFLGL